MIVRSLKRFAAGAAAALAFSLPASATTFSTDYTDLWWAGSGENGWGINLIQQYDIIFATMFVYGSDNTPRWFVASSMQGSGNTFSGALLQTNGPYFGGPYNPALFQFTQVGNISVTFTSNSTASLSYSVNGVNVTKSIQRQTWRNNNLTGKYLGGATASGCGTTFFAFDTLTVTQNGSAITMTVDFNNAQNTASRCTYNGTYNATGRIGDISGTYSCVFGSAAGNTGNFLISGVDGSVNGFNGRYSGNDQFCSAYSGYFGGVHDVF